MQEILALSRLAAQEFTSLSPWAAIQITNLDAEWPQLSSAQRVAVVQFRFPDRHSTDTEFRQDELFSKLQAQQIVDFVEAHSSRIDRLMVHCEQGTSRSTAVAAALTRIFLPGEDCGLV